MGIFVTRKTEASLLTIIITNFTAMEPKVLQDHIAKITIMPEDEMSVLSSCISRHELKKGEPILREGEPCRSFFFVEQGYLRTYYNKNGVPIYLGFTFEGEFTSDLQSFKSRLPTRLMIEAGEKSIVWNMDLKQLGPTMAEHPQISKLVRRLAIAQLLASEAHSDLFKIYTPAERYHYIAHHRPQLLQRLSLSQLASYLGVTRETLSRIRGKR
jgi:CRP-like cAMP-binding protein